MNLIQKAYSNFHNLLSKPQERGEYSSGRWQNKVRVEAFQSCKDINGKLLEAGCGEGLFLAELALSNKDLELYGIDMSGKLLERARGRLKDKNIERIKLREADASVLPFEDLYFDAVVCINVLFNLPSRDIVRKVLLELGRVCKKKGKVIIDFRNKRNILLYLKYKLAPYYDQTVSSLPLNTYTLEDIKMLLADAGLRIKKQTGIGFLSKVIPPIIVLELEKAGESNV
jgi:ubiquinone/menaquinone biosynthesis C-methylase UbiE